MKSRGREIGLVLLLLAVVLVPRVLRLAADPPVDFQTGYLPDEGAWAHNARQHVLFGRWVMEEHNPALFAAPLYTATLAGVYRLFGVGLIQTRLLSAIAGAMTCLLLYGLLRADRSSRDSLPPVLILGFSYFMLTNNRVGFTESLQLLLITATTLAVLSSARRPWWGVIGGVCFVAALLAKPSAAVLGPIFLAFWTLHWALARRDDTLPRFSLRPVAWFALGSGVASLGVVLFLVAPHWAAIQQQLSISARNVYGAESPEAMSRIVLFGWECLGMTLNLFWVQSAVLLFAVAGFLIARLGKALPQRPDLVELLCWAWVLGGVLILATQHYQPDRRFLFLMPPVAILAWQAASGGALRVPARDEWSRPSGTDWPWMLLGAFLGAVLAFYTQPLVNRRLLTLLDLSTQPPLRSWIAGWITSAGLVAGALLGPLAKRLLPSSARTLPSWAFVALFLLTNPGRFLVYLARPTYGGRDAAQRLSEITRGWDRADRVVVGNQAYTLSLGTDLFAFNIRHRPDTGDNENLDGWTRFLPSVAVISARHGRAVQDVLQYPIVVGIRIHGLVPCSEVPLSFDEKRRPAYVARYYVRPDLRRSCPTSPAP
ncbi:MAG TPA: glycosyltransferase family 39 protein [Gemmatimonadales bacterium]|nr:glycosyltransferase family 39 protein [Gemmatimonadales bacterium]